MILFLTMDNKKKGKSKTTVKQSTKSKGNKKSKKDKENEKEKNNGDPKKRDEKDNKLNKNKINDANQVKEINNQNASIKIKEKEIDIISQIKPKDNRDNKTMINNKAKMNLDNLYNVKEQTNIGEFYFLDNYSSINDFVKFKIKDNYKDDNNEIFTLIYYAKNNDLKKDLFKKNDFIKYYEFVYIQFNDKKMNFILPKHQTSNYSENEILNEIKNSFYCKKIERLFDIDFKSSNKKYYLTRIKNMENKFNLEIEEINNTKDNINIINNKDINKIETNYINYNYNNNINNNNYIIQNNYVKNKIYYFPLVGLNNVGSTCFMNATLQCLIHIPELSVYFLNEYPKDKNILNSKNSYIKTRGQLSEAYYQVVKGVDSVFTKQDNFYSSYSPRSFKEVLGMYNSQFSRYEANDSKDLILYLLQTFHEELNYFGDQTKPKNIKLSQPTSREYSYQAFNTIYNMTNFSKISQLFYGTYENIIICLECKTKFYSYQKFEYISLSTYKYRYSYFNIINGFEDITSKEKLEGDNKYYCNKCKKLVNAEIFCKIIDLPNYLILNIDYGKNKIYNVKELIFTHEIDLKNYLGYYFGQKSKFKLIAVCTHIGSSGAYGHYIAYCLNNQNGCWYKFNDSSCNMSDKYSLNENSPYLLIYELI